jgi:rod shape determining protein RodA
MPSDFGLRIFTENRLKGWLAIFNIDWPMFVCATLLTFAGLVTMNSFTDGDYHFSRQLVWLLISIVVFFSISLVDFRFLRRTYIVLGLFLISITLLLGLFLLGSAHKGATSWFNIGGMSFQPVEIIKLILIIILAKYFSRRHIEIANFRHIFVSGFYAFSIFFLVFLSPDFGSAMIVFLIWLGMVLISGIPKKHLLLVFVLGAVAFVGLWFGVLHDYQKARVKNFLNPLADIRGTGYNAYQSTIAVGSGEVLGKGIGYGTQSKLKFLPEYQTDFIFSAFAEEWGFVGVVILFSLYLLLIVRILVVSYQGASNFEILFGGGLAILLTSHFFVNVGMTIGLLPVTGVPLSFMSYGGTNLLTNFIGLGILNGMRRYQKTTHSEKMRNEFLGL